MKYYDGIIKRVNMLEKKNGIFYAKPSGKLFGSLKIIYILVFLYTIFNNCAYLLGTYLNYKGGLADVMNPLITVSVCTLLMIAGFVLLFKKLYLVSAILTVAPSVVLIPTFGVMLKDKLAIKAYLPKYYWRHFIPLLILITLVCFMAIIVVRARIKFKQMYTKVTENLYNLYNINLKSDKDISDEQWAYFLENYDPFTYKPQFIKNCRQDDQNEG